ncbi:unnamed protein product [Alopecurus aequalis]
MSLSSSAPVTTPFENPRPVVKKLLSESQSEGQGATVSQSEHRQARAPEPGPFPHAGRVLSLQAGQIPRPSSPRIRDRHLFWIGCSTEPSPTRTSPDTRAPLGLEMFRIEPKYQELQSKDISRAEKEGVEVRIIAREAFGVRSPVYTRTPTMYMDFTMRPGSQLHQPIPARWNAFVYIIEGEGSFGREKAAPATAHHCLVLGADGDGLSVWNQSGAPLRFALAAGQPLGDPVVQQGPFVMNTRAEIQQAMEDYYYGRNGFEKAAQWSSA